MMILYYRAENMTWVIHLVLCDIFYNNQVKVKINMQAILIRNPIEQNISKCNKFK